MRQYTTPTLSLKIQGQHLSGKDVYVTLVCGKRRTELTFTAPDIDVTEDGDDTYIDFTLTQEQTAQLPPGGTVQIQVNWMIGSSRFSTNIKDLYVRENLLKRILP